MTFNYLKTMQFMDSVDIDDIGNTCINAINDSSDEWYLIVETKNGWAKVTTFGPLKVDSETPMGHSFNYNYFERDFEEKKLYKTINDFINNPKHEITQVFELSIEDGKERINLIKRFI